MGLRCPGRCSEATNVSPPPQGKRTDATHGGSGEVRPPGWVRSGKAGEVQGNCRSLDGDCSDVAVRGEDLVKRPGAGARLVSVERKEMGAWPRDERYVESVEGVRESFADGLDVGLLASPATEEAGIPRGRTHHRELGAFAGAEGDRRDLLEVGHRVHAFDVDADGSAARQCEDGDVAGVRDVEVQPVRVEIRERRFAVGADDEADGGRRRTQVARQQLPQQRASDHVAPLVARESEALGALALVRRERRRVRRHRLAAFAKVRGPEVHRRLIERRRFAERWPAKDVAVRRHHGGYGGRRELATPEAGRLEAARLGAQLSRVISIVRGLDQFLAILRPVFFVVAVLLAVIALVDWLVRTRRLDPFGAIGRFTRRAIDPLFAPVTRAVLRRGGLPAHAPWYALGAAVIAGILILTVLAFIRDQLVIAAFAAAHGSSGLVRLIVGWTFAILQIALLVRVVSSWLGLSPYSRWIRWAVVITEPILAPLRRIVPTIGIFDITPIVAYFLLRVLESLVLGLITGRA